MDRIGVEKCRCGHPACRDYWLTGIGKFVQGSGFNKSEAELIASLLNERRRYDAVTAENGLTNKIGS